MGAGVAPLCFQSSVWGWGGARGGGVLWTTHRTPRHLPAGAHRLQEAGERSRALEGVDRPPRPLLRLPGATGQGGADRRCGVETRGRSRGAREPWPGRGHHGKRLIPYSDRGHRTETPEAAGPRAPGGVVTAPAAPGSGALGSARGRRPEFVSRFSLVLVGFRGVDELPQQHNEVFFAHRRPVHVLVHVLRFSQTADQ